ncbi:MAG: hypothetical protein IPH44_16565 [Myxococcales bacterium]|nr:hypothetical protein [Myxococcales bacterium]MBK7196628.1 hypothetical protein [Myxococcales bacterium]MBP6848479.1 hypothetical protein [Kofleriaceae bacterium]
MSGCTNCQGKSGCDDRKGDMFAAIDETLAALYPERRWRAPGPGDPAPLLADAAALADELADVLRTATFVRPPIDGGAAFVYVLCLGRPPCAVQIRDGELALPDEWAPAATISERYLRVALAAQAPLAGVQEIAVDVDVDADGALVRERSLSGVYSPSLLARFQKVVATLPAYGRRHLDMGELMAPPPGFDGSAWSARYAGAPGVVNYLLFPEPATMTTSVWLPREAA